MGKRIGILGGAFNPPHEGHVHISTAAQALLALDSVIWVPTYNHPWKDPATLSGFNERFIKCTEITANTGILISDIEKTYRCKFSIDTTNALLREYPRDDLVWILGADNAITIHKWRRWKSMFSKIALCVINRNNLFGQLRTSPLAKAAKEIHIIEHRYTGAISPNTLFLLNTEQKMVSSSQIRKTGHDMEAVPAVLDIIDKSKAFDVVTHDDNVDSAVSDLVIIATCLSARHITALAEKLVQFLKDEFGILVTIDGSGESGWIVLDSSPCVIHLFDAKNRELYALEELLDARPSRKPQQNQEEASE